MDVNRRLLPAVAALHGLPAGAVLAEDRRMSSADARMKAIVVGPEGQSIADVSAPMPKPEEVLVGAGAAALNCAGLEVAEGQQHDGIGDAGAIRGCDGPGGGDGQNFRDRPPSRQSRDRLGCRSLGTVSCGGSRADPTTTCGPAV